MSKFLVIRVFGIENKKVETLDFIKVNVIMLTATVISAEI